MMARPRKQIDVALVEKLAAIGCSIEEIASQLSVSESTLYRRYESAIKKGHLLRNITVRQMQWLAAVDGNTTMLIWLGKQYLGQSDKQAVEHSGPNGGPIEYQNYDLHRLSDEELEQLRTLVESANVAK